MKLVTIAAASVTLELDCTDCLALADACGWANSHDIPGDYALLGALRGMLTSAALAAFAVEHGNGEEFTSYTLAELRRLRGPVDTRRVGLYRAAEPA